MAEINKSECADRVYKTLCDTLDQMNFHYSREDSRRGVHLTFSGQDLEMAQSIWVDEQRQIITLLSKLPFTVSAEKQMDTAVAVCIASNGLTYGNFEFHFPSESVSGSVWFRLTETYFGREIDEGLFSIMLSAANQLIDQYNDKIFMVSVGRMSVEEMLQQER